MFFFKGWALHGAKVVVAPTTPCIVKDTSVVHDLLIRQFP